MFIKFSDLLLPKLLSFFTPILAASTLVASPSYAANFSSESFLATFSFNQLPNNIATLTNTNTIAKTGIDSFVNAEAIANSTFVGEPASTLECSNSEFTLRFLTPAGCSRALSRVEAEGNNFSALATSEGVFIAEFSLAPEATFSFDFLASLNLENQANNSVGKRLNTFGRVSLAVFDLANNILLDSLTLTANLDSRGNNDFLQVDGNILPINEDYQTAFGGQDEFAKALVDGTYSRFFNTATNVVLVGFTGSTVTTVPEASQSFGLLFFMALIVVMQVKSFVLKDSEGLY